MDAEGAAKVWMVAFRGQDRGGKKQVQAMKLLCSTMTQHAIATYLSIENLLTALRLLIKTCDAVSRLPIGFLNPRHHHASISYRTFANRAKHWWLAAHRRSEQNQGPPI